MKVYIVCPYHQSGGPRSLHQLANKLIEQGMDVYMYYGYRGKRYNTTTLLYSDCRAKITKRIEDKSENIIIVPESDTGWLKKYQYIKKVIWWLSLYFYLANNIWWLSKFKTQFLYQTSSMTYLRYIHIKSKNLLINYLHPRELKKVDYHLYNCEYVHEYLIKHNISSKNMSYLCGPIDIEKNIFTPQKENIILYNPAKASSYMLKNILKYMNDKYPTYKLEPLQGLSHSEILRYFKKAKVYLDLGYFPGPERMPREACMNYCNIITSTVGAAANNTDVPIPQKFKFDLIQDNVPAICELMVEMCTSYKDYIHYYNKYRKKIRLQINDFSSDIDSFIKAIKL